MSRGGPEPQPEDGPSPGSSLRRVAAFGLVLPPAGGSSVAEAAELGQAAGTGPIEVADGSWPMFLRRLGAHSLTGLATAAANAGVLRLGDSEREQLAAVHRRVMQLNLALEQRLLAATEAFGAEGIEVVGLKGSAVARTAYPDPSWRPFKDLDLLVRTRDWERSCRLLGELGYARKLGEPRPGFDERFGKAATHLSSDGFELDLHRRLVLGPFGLWMDPEPLFDRTATVQVGGRTLRRLGDTDLLLHACIHAALGWSPPLPMPVRDVAQIATSVPMDWDLLAASARLWRLTVVVDHALRTASEATGWEPGDEARRLMTAAATPQEQRALHAYTGDRRWRGATALSSVRAIPGVRSKLAYVSTLVYPSREFLSARSAGSHGSYLTRWATALRWLAHFRKGD